jgi:O-antigen/teichoic acid export membrane protein
MSVTQGEAALRKTPGARTVRRALRSKVVGQVFIYTVAGGAAMGLSGLSKVILARQMTPGAYGSFSFAMSLLALVAGAADLGVFMSVSRRLALSDREGRRDLAGASFVAFVPMAVATSLVTFGLSFVTDSVFHVHAAEALRVTSVIAWACAFGLIGELVAKGADRLYVFSVSNFAGSATLVIALLVMVAAGVKFTATTAVVLTTLNLVLSAVMLGVWLRPRLRGVRDHIRGFVEDTRAWAFQMFIGRFLSIGTYNMDVLMVAAFSNAKSTGFYSLAGALAGFMGIPMLGAAAALFPNMSTEGEIRKQWLGIAWAIGGACVLAVVLLAPPLIGVVFAKDYGPVATLAIPLVIAQGVRGVTTVYNTFLTAHAGGREIRNTAFILTGSNVVFNFALIPPFGATGAAWASLLALLVNYVGYVFYYRQFLRRRQAAPV